MFFQCFVTCPKVTCQQDWLLQIFFYLNLRALLRCIVNPTNFHHIWKIPTLGCSCDFGFQMESSMSVKKYLKGWNVQMVACRPGSEATWPQWSWWLTWWKKIPLIYSIRVAAVCDSFALMKEIIKSKLMVFKGVNISIGSNFLRILDWNTMTDYHT